MLPPIVIGQMEQKALKLYVGARAIKPDGFFTIDLDERMRPDLVADACNMPNIWSQSCEEVIANGVLEHIEWPEAFSALAEFVRVLKIGGTLKIAVPDITSFAQLLLNNDSAKFHVMGIVFGIGGRDNKFEQHRFGYTASMLCELLQVLGCGNFDWMSPLSIGDTSGGWTPRWKNENVAELLNLSCRKIGLPLVPTEEMLKKLREDPFGDP